MYVCMYVCMYVGMYMYAYVRDSFRKISQEGAKAHQKIFWRGGGAYSGQ